MSTIIAHRQGHGANWRRFREAVGVSPKQAAYWARMPLLRLESIEAGMPTTDGENYALMAVIVNAANRRVASEQTA